MKANQPYRSLVEISAPFIVLAVLLIYTFALFLEVPYSGIRWNTSNEQVTNIFIDSSSDHPLKIGDRMIQIGDTHLADFRSDLSTILFDEAQPGQVVSLLVERGGQVVAIPWIYPGFNQTEFRYRLTSQWWISYIFWLCGTIALLIIRPKDARWLLLVLFFFLTSIWLIMGSGPSRWHIWWSPVVMRAAIWLSLPVYLHLHWIFPQPLARLPSHFWVGLYLVGIAFSVAQLFQVIPQNAYYLALFLALSGSFAFLFVHAVQGKEHRREVGLLAVLLFIAIVPVVAMGVTETILPLTPGISQSTLLVPMLALPGIPIAYFYAVFRKRLGEMEGRVNRLVSLYIFSILLMLVFIVIFLVTNAYFDTFSVSGEFVIFVVLLTSLVTALGFPRFQRWTERRILNMPLAPTQLIHTYASRIATSLDRDNLIQLIRDEALPSLLIREAALIRNDRTLSPIFRLNVQDDQLPKTDEVPALIAQSGRYRQTDSTDGKDLTCSWARLILSLSLEGKVVGLCLLGRRDPDDFYAAAEIETLQALMNHTVLAFQNVEQAEQLHALYQDDIQRREAERLSLARELHDDVLQQMAVVSQSVDRSAVTERFLQAYDASVQHIRSIIDGLRPVMLTYGLFAAFEELRDDLSGRNDTSTGNVPRIELKIPKSEVRYPLEVELHLFRIAQQASQNALEHARARRVSIRGSLEPDRVDILVEDDGVGFSAGEQLDLAGLLANQHYGLVGMYERAGLIGAQVKVSSTSGNGTQVHITWDSG